MRTFENTKIAVVGLGYVGLPLAIEFGKIFNTVGYDIDRARIRQLLEGVDLTLEVAPYEFSKAENLQYSYNIEEIKSCNIYIVTVPTPIDKAKKPDLLPLIEASKAIGALLNKDDIVIYESTVFPGATEEICVPILEEYSGLTFNKEFYCGYSPERINPGDKSRRITSIKKVTSGSTPEIADTVDSLYQKIILAGTHKAQSIKIAEAAKVIENTQRDVNIALINELAIIFNRLDIDTQAVLDAAGTKWNFLAFRPGLVGGHCIGIDPYYLTHKSLEAGYTPEIILVGRSLNDSMGLYVVQQVSELMHKNAIKLVGANVLVLGLAFKENCPDIRNSRVIDIINEFENLQSNVDVYDPWVDKGRAQKEFQISLLDQPKDGFYDVIILAVAHDEFKSLKIEDVREWGKNNHLVYDIKYLFAASEVDGRL